MIDVDTDEGLKVCLFHLHFTLNILIPDFVLHCAYKKIDSNLSLSIRLDCDKL